AALISSRLDSAPLPCAPLAPAASAPASLAFAASAGAPLTSAPLACEFFAAGELPVPGFDPEPSGVLVVLCSLGFSGMFRSPYDGAACLLCAMRVQVSRSVKGKGVSN